MYEFHFNGPLLALALNIGLLVGGFVWGLVCDIWGRRFVSSSCRHTPHYNICFFPRWSFNLTLLIAGIFGVAAGA